MRAMIMLMGLAVAGCAGHPSNPQANVVAPAVPAGAPAAGAAPADLETQRLAQARNLNLKVVNKDGQELFCRSNWVTGSHIQRDMRCYTAEQFDLMQAQIQRQADQFLVAPNSQNPATLPPTR
jgi:hypothetical protein